MPLWKKGESGNPAGKPKGSKHKIKQAFLDALQADFEKFGPATFIRARTDNPLGYLKLVADLFPKEEHVTHEIRAVRLWTEMESRAYLTTRELNSQPITSEPTDMQSLSAIDERVKH